MIKFQKGVCIYTPVQRYGPKGARTFLAGGFTRLVHKGITGIMDINGYDGWKEMIFMSREGAVSRPGNVPPPRK